MQAYDMNGITHRRRYEIAKNTALRFAIVWKMGGARYSAVTAHTPDCQNRYFELTGLPAETSKREYEKSAEKRIQSYHVTARNQKTWIIIESK